MKQFILAGGVGTDFRLSNLGIKLIHKLALLTDSFGYGHCIPPSEFEQVLQVFVLYLHGMHLQLIEPVITLIRAPLNLPWP